MSAILEHRIMALERSYHDIERTLEPRVRALEIAHARIVGWAAGGAFVGGLVWNVVSRVLP